METTTTRRNFIRVLGSAGVIFAAGGTVSSCAPVPDSASAPWRMAGKPSPDIRRQVLSHAILAPNPHNRQPWIVDLSTPGEIVLFCDRERLLPETDPFSRQILIGHGCFLELLAIAAASYGQRAEIETFPQGEFPAESIDARPVARIRLIPEKNAKSDPLFRQIAHRRSNKEPYDTAKPVAPATLEKLGKTLPPDSPLRLVTTAEASSVERLREVVWKGMELEISIPRTYMESIRLMRIGKSEIAANPDGIDLGGTIIEIGRFLGMVSREQLADPSSSAYQQGLDMQREAAYSATAFGWLISKDNRRATQVEAGRAYARINLKATELGLDMHPWSQVLQEYPEMETLQRNFFDLSGQFPGERTQMLFRMGHGPSVGPSPRHPLETLVRA